MIFLLELLVLFFSGKYISTNLYLLFQRLLRSRRIPVYLVSSFFFPGVLIHELSHWLMAKVLLVPTGQITLIPQVEDRSVKLGSVEVEKTDFVRGFLISFAPVVGGIGMLVVCAWCMQNTSIINYLGVYLRYIVFGYLMYVIANTMFSSRRDFESMKGFLIVLVIVVIGAYLLDSQLLFQIFTQVWHTGYIYTIMRQTEIVLLVPTIINIGLVGILWMFQRSC